MCGIAGYYNRNGLSRDAVRKTKQMLSVLTHRGPDGSGIYRDKNSVLGHNRLSIIDPVGGVQPMCNEDETLWITFNGEIFNYPELKEQLIAKGHKFKTNSDTEVILHLYEDKKEDCLHYLNGQFAFALRDYKNEELFLARDHCGILPLFYTTTFTGDFIFSSEIKALFCDELVKREINPPALDQVFTFWGTLPGATFFKNICEVPPAHYILIKNGSSRIVKYWEPSFEAAASEQNDNTGKIAEEAYDILEDAVKIRLRADVPVGCYLSGGIDSSGIASVIKNSFNNDLYTFGLLFDEEDYNELKYQKSAVLYLSTNHTRRNVHNTDIASFFHEMMYFTEKPMLRSAPVPMLLLSEAVKDKGYKVVLSGEGSDEIFGGYNIFKEAYIRNFWSKKPESEKRPLLLKKIYPYIFKEKRLYSSLKEFFGYGLNETTNPFFSHLTRWRNTSRLKNFYSAEFKENLGDYNPVDDLYLILPENFGKMNFFARAQYLEFKIFLNGYLLSSQGDRPAMANSVELRVPYLDKRLIDFMAKVPVTMKLRGLNEKYLLKQILKNKLPADIINRQKHPFRAPIKSMFTSNPYLADEYCSEQKIKEAGMFDHKKVNMLFRKVHNGLAFSETDNMAVAGILSAQVLWDTFIKQTWLQVRQPENLHYFDYLIKQDEPNEVFI